MVLAVNITNGPGLSNEVSCKLAAGEEEQGNTVFAVHFALKAV